MQKKFLAYTILFIFALGLLMLAGCASTPSPRFYTLSPMAGPESIGEAQPFSQGRTIGLGPVRFPDYLNRPGIITRTDDNTLQIAEFDHWAGSLKENFTLVMAENLGLLLERDKIVLYPYGMTLIPNIRIILAVTRFEGSLGGKIFLDAYWVIQEGPEKKEGVGQKFRISEPVNGSDYRSLAAAQSRAVERLCREIAKALQQPSSGASLSK